MKRIKTRTLKAAATVMITALALALLTGFVPTPDAAAAASRTTVFQSKLAPISTTAAVAQTTAEPLSQTVKVAARTTTVVRVASTATASSSRTKTPASKATATTSGGSAQSILNSYIARYPILRGTTVSYGDAQGHQAICYYKSGRIVISASHTASLQRIIGHEIWHVIDYRDNGRIDWGENVPPK